MKKKFFILFLFIISFWQSSNASPVVLNGVEYPEDLYNEINGYIRERCLENALCSFDIKNKNVYEILVNIYRKVKFDKSLYCPVCKFNYPVSAKYSNNLKEIVASNSNSQICIDGLPLNVSYQLPAECPLCGGIFSKTNFSPEMNEKFYDFWYSIYQGVIRKNNDKWDMYVWGIEWLNLEDAYGISEIYLKAARTNSHNKPKKIYYLNQALKYLSMHIDQRNQSEEEYIGEEKIYLKIKQADLNRQLQNYKESRKILDNILYDCCQEESYYYILTEHLCNLVEEKVYLPTIQPFGNKLHVAIHENKKIDESITRLINDKFLKQENIFGIQPLYQAIVEQNINYINLLTDTKYLKYYKLNDLELRKYKSLLDRIRTPEITTKVTKFLNLL